MKKGIIVLLIAVLVSGFAFAKFSGNASIQFKGDFDVKDFGFVNGTSSKFSFEFDSESIEIAGEEDLHVEVAASAKVLMDARYKQDDEKANVFVKDGPEEGFGLIVSIDKALVAGSNWYVDILGAKKAYDYAKSENLTAYKKTEDIWGNVKAGSDKDETASSYAVEFNKAPGVTVGFAGFTASVGFYHNEKEDDYPDAKGFYKNEMKAGTGFSATIETPEFAFSDDAVKVQVAAEASKKAGAGKTDAGASLKTAVAIQDITVKLAADFGFMNLFSKLTDKDVKFRMDARADFAYKFASVYAYTFYGKGADLSNDANYTADKFSNFLLEAGANFDLNEFEVPVKVGVYAINIVDKSDKPLWIGLTAEFAKDAITAGEGVEVELKDKKATVTSNTYVQYKAEKFTVGGNFVAIFGDAFTAKAGVYAETDALVKGATFGACYGYDVNKFMDKGGLNRASTQANNNGFKKDANKFGQAGAYCKIAF